MRARVNYDRKTDGLPEALAKEIARLLAENMSTAASKTRRSGKGLSYKTAGKRVDVITSAMKELREQGYKIQSLENFGERHVRALVKGWEARGLSVSTIDNRLSVLRTLATWLGKNGMVKSGRSYASNPDEFNRIRVAERDKSWDGNGIDAITLLEQIGEKHPEVAAQLELQWAFGLRAEESFLMRIEVALMQAIGRGELLVKQGTKGGRDRQVAIDTAVQIDVLRRAVDLVKKTGGTMIPVQYSLEQWRNHYYYVVREHGIRKDGLGVTSHGLRHQYLHQVWTRITGELPPVKGGGAVDQDIAQLAMTTVVERAGHYDFKKSGAYLGKYVKTRGAAKRNDQER